MDAQFQLHNGAITLYINGQPYPCTTYKSTEMPDDRLFEETVQRSVTDLAERGVHVHFVPIFFDWPAPGQYNFSRMDWRLNQVLAADPQAWIVIRVQAASMAPKWWMQANPDGVLRFGFGRGVEMPRPRFQTGPAPSLGSNFWEEAGLPALRALADHVKTQPYLGHMIGYLPTSYNSNEWFLRSTDPLQVSDLCPAMEAAFSRWLQENYGMAGTHRVPDRADRHLADRGYLFDPNPRRSRAPVAAYHRFVNERMAETILQACQVLRQAHAPDRIIVGTFYGYLLELAQFPWLAESGHLALERLLREDGPDFTCSPMVYFTRNPHELPGGGMEWSLSAAIDSALPAGKAYFGEDDFGPPDGIGLSTWIGASNTAEDIALLRHNFGFTLCKGQNQWWYDLRGHDFDAPHRLDVLKECTTIAYEALHRDRSTVSEAAVVMDEKAPMFIQLDLELQRSLFWRNFFDSFARIGAPVDLFLLSSQAQADLSRYKIIFFPNCFSMDYKDRERIEHLKSGGRMLVFYQADGFIDPEAEQAFDLERISALTGITVRADETRQHSLLRMSTLDSGSFAQGFADQPFGLRDEKTLNFYVQDPQAEPIAHLYGRGAVGMARKAFTEWTSIYTAMPELPPQLVHNLLRSAGVHIYTSNREDIVYACASYLCLFTRCGGPRTVSLPQPRRVRERFCGTYESQEPVEEFMIEATPYTTYLFELH
jgi:hypothetical protein